MNHARPQLSGDDYRVRALLQFAGEEENRKLKKDAQFQPRNARRDTKYKYKITC